MAGTQATLASSWQYKCQMLYLYSSKSDFDLVVNFATLILLFAMEYLVAGRRQWQPTPVLLPGKSHGWRSLVGCSPGGREESDTTERLHFHFSLSCIGEGNGNPLQCSCLKNPRDGGAWWAAINGVAQSQTQLKRCSSSSSSRLLGTGVSLTRLGLSSRPTGREECKLQKQGRA